MRTILIMGIIFIFFTIPFAKAQDKDVAKPRTTLQFSGELTGDKGMQWRKVTDKAKLLSVKPASDDRTAVSVATNKMIVPNNHVMKISAEKNETIVIQLLAGEIAIKNSNSKVERDAPGTWVVKPGEVQRLRTEDDAAILRITRLRR